MRSCQDNIYFKGVKIVATNIEIKSRVEDLDKLKKIVEPLSDTPCEILSQEDTFFNTPKGRLKLRKFTPEHGELIYYERKDAPDPQPSNYLISETNDTQTLKTVLMSALGIRGIVRKQRWLYKIGNVRIHLDQVEGLGSFLELEVVLAPGQSPDAGVTTAMAFMQKLGVRKSDLVEGAYIDLLDGSKNFS